MIIGIGSDIMNVDRIRDVINRHGDRFIRRVFAADEIQKAQSRAATGQDIATYAKRFAAKEACAKALGTGVMHGVFLKDMVLTNDDHGKPTIYLTGGAAAHLARILPAGHVGYIHVSITDDGPITQAFVVIEARPAR
jgi:holo-[acyl-carrier protein] synthase